MAYAYSKIVHDLYSSQDHQQLVTCPDDIRHIMGRKRKRVNDDVISVTSVTSSGVGCEQVGATSDGKTSLTASGSPCQDASNAEEPAPRNAANERERARMRVYYYYNYFKVPLVSKDPKG